MRVEEAWILVSNRKDKKGLNKKIMFEQSSKA